MKTDISMSFEYKQFIMPDSSFWPGYLWFWNDHITEHECIQQLSEMKAVGAKNIWIIPLPSNFRPKTMKTDLKPAYLTAEYLLLYQKIVKVIADFDMNLWLYDDAGWPSGSVCGEIVKNNPQLSAQYLYKEELFADCSGNVLIPEDCLAAYVFRRNVRPQKIDPGVTIKFSNDILKVELVGAKKHCSNGFVPPYPDLLHPNVSNKFIDLTHEVYKHALSDEFGKTVPILVSDEPCVSSLPWTDDFDAEFYKDKGYYIKDKLYCVFGNDDAGREVRIDFFDWWSKRFAQVFFSRIQKWCSVNSLLYAGHLGGEDKTIGSRIYGYGHILRILRLFDVPGVDTIWKQIFPGQNEDIKVQWNNVSLTYPICSNHHFPKYASSVAHQGGKRWSWTESFSAYGSALTLEEMKWIINFQYVRGINLVMACQRHYSLHGHYIGSMRPIFSCENPLYRHMEIFNSYTARLSYLLSMGKPSVDTAVYLPIRDIWAGGSRQDEVVDSNDRLTQTLLENQCDFDMIDDDVLENAEIESVNGHLIIGSMSYKTVCLSITEYISGRSITKLNCLIKAGGNVLLFGNAEIPGLYVGYEKADYNTIHKYIEPTISLKDRVQSIKVCKRIVEQGNFYFITNEDFGDIWFKVKFKETKPAYLLNPESGNYSKLDSVLSDDKQTCTISLVLPFAGSHAILFTDERIDLEHEIHYDSGKIIWKDIDSKWYCRKKKTLRIINSEFVSETLSNDDYKCIKLGDWRSVLGEGFSGDAEYLVEFVYEDIPSNHTGFIDLGKVNGVCEVELNGISLGKRAWHPYTFTYKNSLKDGTNVLRIIVTNTMANLITTANEIDQWPDTVLGTYHKQCLAMEKDNTCSGIYGPVRAGYLGENLQM